jgi:hypothetical protein
MNSAAQAAPLEAMLSIRDLADKLKTTPNAAYKLKKKIRHVKLGARVLFWPGDVRAYLESRTIDPRAAAPSQSLFAQARSRRLSSLKTETNDFRASNPGKRGER